MHGQQPSIFVQLKFPIPMNEIVIVTSSKDSGGVGVIDLATGSHICSNFKNCVSDPGTVCLVGGTSGHAGIGCKTSDYVCISQSKKPVINVWAWGKSQVHMQCHIQEITTSLTTDPNGSFIFGGTKKGSIYVWEISSGNLLTSWQAHFKEVSRLCVSPCGSFLVSASGDGMARVWDIALAIDESDIGQSVDQRALKPFR